ncbi:MAG: hypothetical protein P4L64_05590 [Caulobacteraceae bacterium]|nr:hypothetical protein [Caulobacteraceae bacterium]
MSVPGARRSLPRRDLILLPLIAAVTALVFLVGAEGAARMVWPEQKVDQCVKEDGPMRPRSNCSSRDKAAEGPWVEMKFNACGYRGTGPCLPPPRGASRLAVLGSSTSWGYLIPFEDVWSVRTAKAMSAQCGGPIDVQSLGGFNNIDQAAARLPEALALKPQMVAWVVAPFDLLKMPEGGFDPVRALQPPPPSPPYHPGLMDRAKSLMTESRAATIAQHYIYGNAQAYAATYLHYGDRADFLRAPLSKDWQARLAVVDAAVAYLTDGLKPSGAKLLLVYAPQQAQADLIAAGTAPKGVDPEILDRALADIAARHGALFVDGGRAFKGVKNAPDYFYRADGHLNGAGQGLLAQAAVQTLLATPQNGLCAGAAR